MLGFSMTIRHQAVKPLSRNDDPVDIVAAGLPGWVLVQDWGSVFMAWPGAGVACVLGFSSPLIGCPAMPTAAPVVGGRLSIAIEHGGGFLEPIVTKPL